MTPTQQKLALRLYKRYKTDTWEYKRLAESLGLSTGELNAKCWAILKAVRDRKAGAV